MTIVPAVGQIWDTRSGARVAIVEEYGRGLHPMLNLVVLNGGTSALHPGYKVAIYATGLQANVPGAPLPLDLVKLVGAFNSH